MILIMKCLVNVCFTYKKNPISLVILINDLISSKRNDGKENEKPMVSELP